MNKLTVMLFTTFIVGSFGNRRIFEKRITPKPIVQTVAETAEKPSQFLPDKILCDVCKAGVGLIQNAIREEKIPGLLVDGVAKVRKDIL